MPLVARWIIVSLIALFPIASHAMALGKLQVLSALNEPLNAEIELTLVSDKELKGLTASLASRADFDAAGVDRPPFLSQIKFMVAKKPDGRYFLQLHTDEPVDEPFLHLLMQIDWPGGRLVREYTALIDPPYQITSKTAPVEVPIVTAPTPVPSPEVQPAAPAPVAEAAPAEVPAPKEEVPPAVAKPEEAKAPEETTAQTAPPKEEAAKEAPPTEAVPEPKPLGPPEVAQATPPPEPTAPTVEPLAATPKAEPGPAPETPPQTAPGMKPAPAPVWAAMPEYNVKRGDTLWRIAEKARADNKDMTVEQVILAIYQTNKEAFYGNNVNNLKAGKILKIPERDEVEAIAAPKARHEFRAQYDAWQEYKLKLAGASHVIKVNETPEMAAIEKAVKPAETPALPEVAKKAPAEPKPPAPNAADKNQQGELLKIVRSTLPEQKSTPDMKVAEKESTKDAASREQQALAERATTLEESLESKRLENKDLSDKVGIVRSQLKKESRLIELENQSLAQQQNKTPVIKPEENPAKATVVTPTAPNAEQKVKIEPLPLAAKLVPSTVAPAKRLVPPKPAPKEEEKSFLATVLEALQSDLLMPAIIGIVVLLGGGVALVYFRRRQKSIAEFEESILSADAISTEQPATTGTPPGQQPPAVTAGGDTSFLSDFSQGGMGNIHTDEVDPVAEAEVYLAYGRDETAEEILKEAMVKNPDRHELKLKLLEIYHQRNDVPAFETLAEELYAALGGRGGKIWEKVEEMGRKLNPENPMFRGGAPGKTPAAVQAAKPAASAVTSPVRKESRTDMPSAATATAAAKTETAGDFDFDIAAPAASGHDFSPAPAPTKTVAAETGLESLDLGTPADNAFDFDVGAKTEVAPESGLDFASAAAPAGHEVQWEPNKSAAPAAAVVEIEAAEPPPAGDGQASAQWDETATKLDLAKAYIDMGDAEGARSILQEVMAEGSEAQKKQAQELSSQIA